MSDAVAVAEAAIERLRRNIDEIDEVLVKLLNQRARWALEIGVAKQRVGIPIYQPEREARVFEHVTAVNRGPLEADAIRRLFERVVDENRRLERTAHPTSSQLSVVSSQSPHPPRKRSPGTSPRRRGQE